MSGIIVAALITATVVNFTFSSLLLTSMRRRPEYYWFLLLVLSIAFWTLGVTVFLSIHTDGPSATAWVREYYVAGVTVALTLLGFTLWFPRHVGLKRWMYWVIGLFYVAVIGNIVSDSGLIDSVEVSGTHVVNLDPLSYLLFVAFFIAASSGALSNLINGEYYARSKKRRHLALQLRIVIFGSIISLATGSWFNIILPLFGNYQYVWVGPLCALLFVFTILYAVIRQGLFDIRQSLVRTSGFVLVVAILALLYAGVTYILTQLFFTSFFRSFWGVTAIQMVLVLIVALTIVPLRQWYVRMASRVVYGRTYDNEYVIDTLKVISQREIKTSALLVKSLRALAVVLEPHYATAYIMDADGDIVTYNGGSTNPTEHQNEVLRNIIKHHVLSLPAVGRMYDIDHLRQGAVYRLLGSARVGAFMRLEAQDETLGMIFLSHKQSGKLYHGKDLRLLDTIRGELSLAVQNSLRFREIEQFTATLERRIETATGELRASNNKLQQLDAAKDEFISMASHQLRTPLTSVKGYIDMVLEGDAGKITPQQRKLLSEAFTSSERMVHLIGDFLNVSRLQTGKFILEKRPTDLTRVTRQEVESLRTTALAHDLQLSCQKLAQVPLLNIDESKIRQVIMNFIDNAIYYSRPSSTIYISLCQEAGDIVLEITDAGIGVPNAEQKHLFTKFFRATNARRQRPDGTGVGLFLTKKVIDAHHGQIIFRSTEGKGSVFGFRLPLARLRIDDTKDTDNENHH